MKDCYYKFYSIEGLKATLRETKMKWSTPSEFNDPFDNQFSIIYQEDHNETKKLIIKDFIQKHPPNKYLDEALNEAKLYPPSFFDQFIAEQNQKIEEWLKEVSIFCVTEEVDDLLMWSHYAEGHKGGAVKFLPNEATSSPFIVAKPVSYLDSIPRIPLCDYITKKEKDMDLMNTITLTKGKAWSYEKEWRIVFGLRDTSKSSECLPFAEQDVGALYLGCRMSEKDKEELLSIMKEKYPHAEIYQSVLKKDKFELEFQKQ